ncbi:LANO_0B07888g1_1 [Lachancea nothofagi CBS 11611]|uniref:LANO_0B07888g1_1 n=1 Tax=Lachancea nothofagi CBS 11611 TaxID=1266666 RepID=A0A1G4J0P4_9SACH|nr:LANO_0B07888g1_1 [Lachancea nothofagi CBS 11611]
MDPSESHELVRTSEYELHDENDDVIEIESCAEDEAELQRAASIRRRASGRAGGRTNRFANRQRHTAINSPHNAESVEGDDEVEVVDERILDDGGPLNPRAGYIDLEREGAIRVAQIRPRQPPTENTEEEEVVFLGQNTVDSSFVLNLPGGERLTISGSPLEQPMRRSFQNQSPRSFNSSNSRARLQRRATNRAQQLFIHSPEDSEDQILRNGHRMRDRIQQRESARETRSEQHLRRQRASRRSVPTNDPEFARIQDRIARLPPGVLAAFDEAQSIQEFQSILQEVDRRIYEQREHELTNLYSNFRGHVTQSWANERMRRSNVRTNNNTRTGNRRPEWMQSSGDLANPNARHPSSMRSWIPSGYGSYFGRDMDEARETQSLIEMIQAREEQENDTRKRKYMEASKTQQHEFLEKANSLPENYSSSFDTTPKMNISITNKGKDETISVADDDADYTEVPVCTLCGVELGVGIPDDHKGSKSEDRGVSFEALVAKYQFHCPFQTLQSITTADRDLSRRTYVAVCGHMFCGRCFKRLDTASAQGKMSKKKLKDLGGPSHPDNYGPKQCPADNCRGQLRSRFRMKEAFF